MNNLCHLFSEDAKVHLDSAIAHSMAYVKATSERIGGDIDAAAATTGAGDLTNFQRSVDNYTKSVLASYDASADKLNIVVKEFRLALWGNGNEAWNAMRRTGKPMNAKGSELQWTREVLENKKMMNCFLNLTMTSQSF